MPEDLKPKDHAEALAVFRAQVIGPLLQQQHDDHGALSDTLRQLAAQPRRPPGSDVSRCYAASTIERWYYAYKKSGLSGLKPQRQASGYAHALTDAQRQLLLQTRRDHPGASASLILRTLIAQDNLPKGAISAPTLRRMYRRAGLDRRSLSQSDAHARRRWQTHAPNVLWHSDVCHGPALRVDGRAVPLRIHALLDDHSRYVLAVQACTNEREAEMLALMVKAARLHGLPQMLYLDNGATYSGKALATMCSRLGTGLLHAQPYDPQARGKMERFWRTLREQCLSHCGGLPSVHAVQVRLLAWLDQHYHCTPHSALMGKTPAQVYTAGECKPVSEEMLREALIVHGKRRVRRDGTVSIAGTDFEVKQGYLAGQNVVVARSLLDPSEPPWLEHEEQRHVLHPVDSEANAKRPRPKRPTTGLDAVPFDPATALLKLATKEATP